MANSGGLSCPDSQYRMYTYYNMGGIPDTVFDGVVRVVGAGGGFWTIAEAHISSRLAIDSPLSVSVLSYDFVGPSPYITVKVKIFDTLASNANTFLRVGVCENNLVYSGSSYNNVLRDMPPDTPLTIMNAGETQEVTIPLTIGGTWNPDELWAFAFVQRDSDREIYNAGSTFITPYTMGVDVEGDQQVALDAPYTFGETTITHLGSAPDNIVDISLDLSSLPTGWDGYFTLEGVDMTSTTVTLGQYESAALNVTLIPGPDPGSGRVVLNVHSQSGEVPDINKSFVGLVAGSDILIVSDDAGAGYAYDYFGPAIGSASKSFAVWERSLAPITLATLSPYEAVIWQTGNNVTGLDVDDRSAIQSYTAAGGGFVLSGEKVVSTLMSEAGGWGQFYLRIVHQGAETGGPTVTGVVDDPISDGLVLNLVGGDGAGNYDDPDVVEPVNGGGGVQLFSYDADSGAGVRAEYGNAKVLTLGFGFESINDVAHRELLMQRILNWFNPTSAAEDNGGLPSMAVLHQNVPNPFNPQTKISFNLESQAKVKLSIYDVTGRLVRVLVDEVREAGEHNLIWDGRDSTGDQMASGTYFYRLIDGKETVSRKMTMIR